MLLEMASLSFIADFLRDLFKDVAKDKIKDALTPNSAANAKKTVFALYQTLERVAFLSDQFVFDVKDLTDFLADTTVDLNIYIAKCDTLVDTMQDISYALRDISTCVGQLNPQLQIYKPDLVQQITQVGFDRSAAIMSVKEGIYQELGQEITLEAIQSARPQLLEALKAANTNRQNIHEAADKFRAFIVSEYSFKESF